MHLRKLFELTAGSSQSGARGVCDRTEACSYVSNLLHMVRMTSRFTFLFLVYSITHFQHHSYFRRNATIRRYGVELTQW